MSMNDPASMERRLDARLRVLFIVWAAQLMSLMMFVLLSVFVMRSNEAGNPLLFWVFAAVGVILVAASFLVKQKFLAQAGAEQNEMQSAARAQSGYITAWALCEAAGLFGILVRGITSSPYYYLLFIIAMLGMLINIPRRGQIAAVSFKRRF